MTGAWLEVFKTGTHTSGNGITKTYTDADLDNIATRYNTQESHDAPLVLGHPATDAPAYGWAKELKAAGGKLLAYVDQVSDDVVNAVKMGAYKKVSIALYPDGLLRHIGLLGATPPAIKGLTPVQFAEGVEFEEYIWATDETRMPTVARVLSGIRDFFIEKFGLEVADRVLDKDDIAGLQRAAPENLIVKPSDGLSGGANNFSENQQEEEKQMDELKAKIKALEDALAAQSALFAELQSGVKVLTDAASAQAQAAADASKKSAAEVAQTAFAEFCEALVREGKVLAAEKDGIVEEYADLLRAEESMTFAEGDARPSEKQKTRPTARTIVVSQGRVFADPDKAAQQKLDPKAVPVEFAEIAGRVDATSVDIDQQIREYAKANNVDYEVAAERFMKA